MGEEKIPWGRRLTFGAVAIVLGSVTIFLVISFLYASLNKSADHANSQKCASSNLQSIGIASIMYSNDNNGSFPHGVALKADNDEVAVSKIYRSFISHKYLDNPESFICPNSKGRCSPIRPTQEIYDNPKLWHWGPWKKTAKAQPPGLKDPPLSKNTELSYTWRRKALKAKTARSTKVLACCKEPHVYMGGVNVLFADAHIEFIYYSDPRYDTLTKQLVGAPKNPLDE
ncbi:MAG: hypothetical protein P1V97_28740 [Planctomycetota bacterium]|nr:hypothetical protein [Planctomycetota bacterium]